jgi:hypothetical protein
LGFVIWNFPEGAAGFDSDSNLSSLQAAPKLRRNTLYSGFHSYFFTIQNNGWFRQSQYPIVGVKQQWVQYWNMRSKRLNPL